MKHLALAVVLATCSLSGCGVGAPSRVSAYADSPQQFEGRFRNPVPPPPGGLMRTLGLFWELTFSKPPGTEPATAVPVRPLTRAQLLAAPDGSLWRFGHSTVLLKLRGGFWLTDPMFSERASPTQLAGPKRFHPTPMGIADLPEIQGVILSHNHYDHLDQDSIVQLAAKTAHFITPLGIGDTLIEWGVPAAKVRQLDWWQETSAGGIRIVATPAQHFTGRGLSDGNQVLWASWVIQDADLKLFYSGDTGYSDHFKTIGARQGPFDVTLIENGSYDQRWPYVHLLPEQAVQAHLDLRGRWLVPVHNGTFDLAFHPWQEPMDRVVAEAAKQGVSISTPAMGEHLNLRAPHAGTPWWRTPP